MRWSVVDQSSSASKVATLGINSFNNGNNLFEEGEVAEQLEFFPVQSPCREFASLTNAGFVAAVFVVGMAF